MRVVHQDVRRRECDSALQYARRLRGAESGEVEWWLMEALLHELKGDLAERLFKKVLAEKPLLVRALHGLALCMHIRLEGPTVFEMLEKALQLAVSEEWVLQERNIELLIAHMHVVKDRLDVASEKLQDLINEDPRDFWAHLCQAFLSVELFSSSFYSGRGCEFSTYGVSFFRGIVYALIDKKGGSKRSI